MRRSRALINMDWAYYAWRNFVDEHWRSPRSREELVAYLLTINPALEHENAAQEIVERWWLDLVRQYTDSRLLVESAPNAPRLPTVA